MKRPAIFFFLFALIQSAFGQEFPEFIRLREKSDSAYEIKEYSLATEYSLRALNLPTSKRPKAPMNTYYDLACLFSLQKEKHKALEYLTKSFELYKVSDQDFRILWAVQACVDSDLEFIRGTEEYKSLLIRFLPTSIVTFSTSKHISYKTLMSYIELVSPEILNRKIAIKDKVIYWEKSTESFVFNDHQLNFPNFKNLTDLKLQFVNCEFQLNFVWYSGADPDSLARERPMQAFDYNGLVFENCNFWGQVFLHGIDFIYPPSFVNCNLSNDLWVSVRTKTGRFVLKKNKFNYAHISLSNENPIQINIEDNFSNDSSDIFIESDLSSEIQVHGNNFNGKNIELSFSSAQTVKLSNNIFKNLIISSSKIESEFDLLGTTSSGKFLLSKLYFSNDPVSDIDLSSFSRLPLGLLSSKDEHILKIDMFKGTTNLPKIQNQSFITGSNKEDIANSQSFRELIGLYSMFLNLYKNKNDIESYNACYIEIKELQSKRLKYLYESNPSFQTYFRWKLSQLLKFYVSHGTDPARAIVISINIIICFGIFFFFFPSDWDTTSKSKLVQNFKDFIQKNEKGYIKPFFVLFLGFLVSLLNALTLSLNAFITLGFGNIPTHGIARYVCVLEGFLGWFLLSIFTVALINQVI